MAGFREDPRTDNPAITGGFASHALQPELDASASPLTVRRRFLGDALGWALAAALVIMLGAITLATVHLLNQKETVAAPLPAFSAEAAAWLAGEQEVAVYREGKVMLYGVVQSEAERQSMIDLATRALGVDNVVASEYYVDAEGGPRAGTATMRVADPVLFEFNSAAIAPDFESVLTFAATVMSQNPNVVIEVIGHTDDVGEVVANQRLSQARAQAAADAIVARGGDAARISAEGRGESEPIATNATEDGRSINRRVEFVLTGL